MEVPKTQRKFEQRFLNHPDRRIREEAAAVRKGRFNALKKRYGTMLLGASLAMGGLGVGIPMKLGTSPQGEKPQARQGSALGLTTDLQTAQTIAREVAGGVEQAAQAVVDLKPLETVQKDVTLITEKAKEEFFKKEIPFGSLIYQEAIKNDLKPELVAAVVKAESRFKPTARSPVGARGLMQLMPATGRWMGAKNLMDPTQNVKAGTKYLKYLNERFDGNETKVIAAYNAGEGNVRKFRGIPPFKETRNYVQKVTQSTSEYEAMVADHVSQVASTGGVAGAGL
jgi:soluble lytic murein transglycosylase-like protein